MAYEKTSDGTVYVLLDADHMRPVDDQAADESADQHLLVSRLPRKGEASMPLSVEQMEKAREYFRLNGVVPDCPYCSTHGWEGGEIISATVVDAQGNARAEAVPMAQFICSNCGHISLFDAKRLGLISS